jgi:hypothetical protein
MTAIAIPEGLEPLAVWDVRERLGPWREWTNGGEETSDSVDAVLWAIANTGPARDIYRIEFHLIDAPFAVVYRYKRNGDGFKYQDPETDSIATEPPVIVPLAELPPAHLLTTSPNGAPDGT